CGVSDYAMMLHLPESGLKPFRQLVCSEETDREPGRHGLSIAHVTLHTSIASVPRRLTRNSIVATTILMRDFLQRLGSLRQSIAVAALNPHGGENGLFGNEEATLISPAVEAVAGRGCRVTGPLPVDTLIRRAVAGEFDGVVAMYHDQGHIPIKLIGFDSAINITLGLPIVRTSPTHGTAFDRAWNPATPANAAGMIEAVIMAAELSRLDMAARAAGDDRPPGGNDSG
ncbi:MAG: 4-hydroxythreonine-4-phosphate dehydrogenase PdxA, partial [Planctomycetaceae bacterium]